MSKRTEKDILLDILECILLERKIKQTKVMQLVNLCHEQVKKYLLPLIEKGFLHKGLDKSLRISREGIYYYKRLVIAKTLTGEFK